MLSTSKLVLSAAVVTTVASLFPTTGRAVVYLWDGPTSGGAQNWQDASKWNPNSAFPNTNLDQADLRIGLTNGLTLDVGATSVTTGALYMGGTGSAVTTNVTSTGGGLLLDNADTAFNGGNVMLHSSGAVGTVNTITAPVTLLDTVTTDGTLDTTINGSVTASGGNRNFANLIANTTVTFNGTMSLSEPAAAAVRGVTLGSNNNATGNIVVNGVIENGGITNGTLTIGGTSGNSGRTTVYLNTSNTYSGTTSLNRGNLYLNSSSGVGVGPIGTGTFQGGGQANGLQRNIYANGQDITLSNTINLNNHLTFAGDYSIKLTGILYEGNSRIMVNNITTANSKNLTFDGAGFAICMGSDLARTVTLDGTGTTEIKSPILNHRKPLLGFAGDANDDTTATGSFVKGGTGVLNITNDASVSPSTYKGFTAVRGGILQFSVPASYGQTSGILVHRAGAVTLLSVGASNAAFLGKIQSAAGASAGALALTAGDAAVNFDFSAGNMSHANTAGMSLGAVPAGISYTGTITPPAAGYRLGGGGTLTLPNANQLTGAFDLTVPNGGTVVLGASNNYTGKTVIKGTYVNPLQIQAAQTLGDLGNVATLRIDSTLSISAPASLGSPTNDAANLVISGGTLRYTGGAASTNRLFTINPTGATLDASGTGAINFANIGANVSADVGAITGDTSPNGNIVTSIADTSELTVGMTVSGGNLPGGTTITGFANTISATGTQQNQARVSANTPALMGVPGATLTIGNQNRTLTLTGSNTDANTIAGVLSNSGAGTLSVTKSGAGTWVLGGANTYSGGTTVQAGTLVLANQTASGTAAITINDATAQVQANLPTGVAVHSIVTTGTGEVDLTNGAMVVKSSNLGAVAALIATGYNDSAWDGVGINSSVAEADALVDGLLAIGFVDNAELGLTDFEGVEDLVGTEILVKVTYYGDTDLSGDTSLDDFFQFLSGFNNPGADTWYTGDFNYSGETTLDDFFQFLNGYNNQGDPLSALATAVEMSSLSAGDQQFMLNAIAAVPEPTALGLVAGAGLLMVRRRYFS